MLCLQHKSSTTTYHDAKNRFDDFHAVHHAQTPEIHFVGHFALWHRFLLAEYERTLRDVCGYRGGQPFWDWSLDADTSDNFSTTIFETDIFSAEHGFGGNGAFVEADSALDVFNLTGMGRTGGGCVQDGPFTAEHFLVNVNQTKPQCLTRDFVPKIMNWCADPANVAHVLEQPDYTSFAFALEGIPAFTQPNVHASGHFGVGGALGTLGNQYNSPGDPLFYLHHGNLDRIFWQWQQKDLHTRLNEVGGPVVPFDYNGVNVTLDFEVNLGEIHGPEALKQLLDTEGGVLCYTYLDSGTSSKRDGRGPVPL